MGDCQQKIRGNGNVLERGCFVRITEKSMSANERSIYSKAYECFDF